MPKHTLILRTALSLVLAAAVLVVLPGCSLFNKEKKPKSSSRMYEGDSPTIHFSNERETAGGMFNPS